ncbi:MAG TPA: DUF3617 family protein [Stellaceae bacterium]|jgi:hypothetical protein
MNIRLAQGALLSALIAGMMPAARAADEIKGGKWQFTTQMQMPPMAQAPPGAQARPVGNPPMTRTACIDPAHPIPPEQQCKLDNVQRSGGNVTWSMTCNSPQGQIQSAGSARYAGETMEASLTARIPGPSGQPIDAPGRITGRYLGPCDAK